MLTYLVFSFNILDDIYRRGAYSSIALGDVLPTLNPKDRRMVTRLVNGVLEHDQEWVYMLSKLCDKQPKAVCRVILKLGMYAIKYMNALPPHVCVNEIVELTKTVKRDLAGFVNATLKAYIAHQDDLPAGGLPLMCIRANMPEWLVNTYYDQYGLEEGARIMTTRYNHTHIRWNEKTYSRLKLRNYLIDNGITATDTPHGYLVGATAQLADLIKEGKATAQALDSIYICRALLDGAPAAGRVLDLCAAPGGKSVYIAEHSGLSVTSCDIHPHRVELIRAYSKRMKASLDAIVWDGTDYNAEWAEVYDAVLVDAPCSGLGVLGSNPDMILNRTSADLAALPGLQSKLLNVASLYVKPHGVLVYSTCTNLRTENEDVITEFLLSHPQFALEGISGIEGYDDNVGMIQFQPDPHGNDGFFVARLKRK